MGELLFVGTHCRHWCGALNTPAHIQEHFLKCSSWLNPGNLQLRHKWTSDVFAAKRRKHLGETAPLTPEHEWVL